MDVDTIISRLTTKNIENPIDLKEDEIINLCQATAQIFLKEKVCLQLTAPMNVCGDIHGQFSDLLRIFELGGDPSQTNYLFLGDYVDRGKQSLECICLLFAYKIKYTSSFFLLRGNHESASINRIYGFFDECKRRYSVKLWKIFTDSFNCLPVAAIISDRVFCVHGGLSPELKEISDIESFQRPNEIPESGLITDLLWSDPSSDIAVGWGPNERGVSVTFSELEVDSFLTKFNFDLICRAHQVVEDGFEFFAERKLVTIFSAPNYCGEFDNAAAILNINQELLCSFSILKPIIGKKKES